MFKFSESLEWLLTLDYPTVCLLLFGAFMIVFCVMISLDRPDRPVKPPPMFDRDLDF